MISPGSTSETGLLPGLADGRLVDGLVDLEEAAGLGPPARCPGSIPRRMRTSSPVFGDREDGDDEARIDVGDVPARRAGQAVAVLAREPPKRAGSRIVSRSSGSTPSTAARRRPMARSVERPSGPRSNSSMAGHASRTTIGRRASGPSARRRSPRPRRGGTGPCPGRPASTPRPSARCGGRRRRS